MASGYAIWATKRWAWKLSIIINVLGLVTSLIALALGSVGSVVGLVLNVVALYYLMRKHVRTYLEKGKAAQMGMAP